MSRNSGENLIERNGVEHQIAQRDADREAKVADAVDDESFDGRGIGRRTLVPVANEQIGDEAHTFPAEEKLQQVVGRDQHEHGEGEQREVGKKPGNGFVMRHVAGAVDMDEHGHCADHGHHDQTQCVLPQSPVRREAAYGDPVGKM